MTRSTDIFRPIRSEICCEATWKAYWSAGPSRRHSGISKSRFFALLKIFRQDPEAFAITYRRGTPRKISEAAEEKIKKALLEEKELIENRALPMSSDALIFLPEKMISFLRLALPSRRTGGVDVKKAGEAGDFHDFGTF